MATFGRIVDLAEVKTATKARTPRDLSYLEPYKDALKQLQSAGIDSAAGVAGIEPNEYKQERNRMRAAAKALNVGIRVRFRNNKSEMVYYIDPEAKVPVTNSSYAKLSAEAKERGITIAALREEKNAAKEAAKLMGVANAADDNDEPKTRTRRETANVR